MKKLCDYCTNEVEFQETMCEQCLKSFTRTAKKMKFSNIQSPRDESKLNLEEN